MSDQRRDPRSIRYLAAAEGSLLLGQWQGGKLRIVAPKSAATTTTVVNLKPGWAR